MRLNNVKEINDFLAVVDSAQNDVWLESPNGDKYNLKSKFTQYVAIGALLSEHGDELELFCANRADENLFINFFMEHPNV